MTEQIPHVHQCPVCHGSGTWGHNDDPCRLCSGTGRVAPNVREGEDRMPHASTVQAVRRYRRLRHGRP